MEKLRNFFKFKYFGLELRNFAIEKLRNFSKFKYFSIELRNFAKF